ncbi:MAG: toll/interleukin-1 receptor domain-containing protein [Flavobacteriaceae bacterium]|nr:toll/interleukin-1 receptor domain-containing protein [Flavobacteriaceae bacterium]
MSQLKNELEKYGISSFVAHEDIEPTKEWQVEIEKGLFSMDALCAILMPGFNDSKWTDQEIGFALGRELLIIPVRKDLDPYGFIGKYQGIQAKGKNIGQVAKAIFNIISTHEKTKFIYISNIVDLLLLSNDITEIKNRINSINKINNFPIEKAKQIYERITENKNFSKPEPLKLINAFFSKNGLEKISKSNFEHDDSQVYDDLPF